MSVDEMKSGPSLADEFAAKVEPRFEKSFIDFKQYLPVNLYDRIFAGLRAVEAEDYTREIEESLKARIAKLESAVETVRAFSPNGGECLDVSSSPHNDGCIIYARGYRDGVEAVQAFLEGEP